MEEISTSWIIISIGTVLFLAYYAKMIVNRFKIPDVTGFVILGVIVGALFSEKCPSSWIQWTSSRISLSL
jgi:Kef-type K+ transport system membrane component KefB